MFPTNANLGRLGNSIAWWLGIEPYELFLYVFLPPLLLDAAVRIDFFLFKRVRMCHHESLQPNATASGGISCSMQLVALAHAQMKAVSHQRQGLSLEVSGTPCRYMQEAAFRCLGHGSMQLSCKPEGILLLPQSRGPSSAGCSCKLIQLLVSCRHG